VTTSCSRARYVHGRTLPLTFRYNYLTTGDIIIVMKFSSLW
jgi:hypothetical protein